MLFHKQYGMFSNGACKCGGLNDFLPNQKGYVKQGRKFLFWIQFLLPLLDVLLSLFHINIIFLFIVNKIIKCW